MADGSSRSQNGDLCTRAIATSDNTFCRVGHLPNQHETRNTIVHNIYVTHEEKPGYYQSTIMAMAQLTPWTCNARLEHMTRSLYCVDGTCLIRLTLDPIFEVRPVTRRIAVGGTPDRIMYSKQHNTLIVGLTHITTKENRRTNGTIQGQRSRFLFPALEYVHPNENSAVKLVETEESDGVQNGEEPKYIPTFSGEIIGKSGERILGLMEWTPMIDGDSYHLLAVNTLRAQHDPASNRGQVYLFNMKRNEEGEVKFDLKLRIKLDNPVYAITPYNQRSLVLCSGRQLVIKTLKSTLEGPRWEPEITHPLLSNGRCVSVNEPYIYVSTDNDSLCVFRLDTSTTPHTIVPVANDTERRSGITHLLLPEHSLVIASSLPRTVTGHWHPPNPQPNTSTTTLFKAILPGSITRLHFAPTPPPWSPRSPSAPPSLLGSSADGSFYALDLLPEAELRLLRFVQEMAERDPRVCPHLAEGSKRAVVPRAVGELVRHVDGDVLRRVWESTLPGCGTLLREWLGAEEERVARKFEGMVEAVVGDLEGRDVVGVVVGYLGSRLTGGL